MVAARWGATPPAITGVGGRPTRVADPYAARVIGMVWTIGHSGHASARLVELLRAHAVEVVVDVRSAPYSRIHSQHVKAALSSFIEESGMTYRFLGRELGGRPDDPDLYDADGHVRYDALAETAVFRRGIERLVEITADARVSLLCAEEDPAGCHRRLLIGRVLADHGVAITHVRGDGSVVAEDDLAEQLTLFDAWRSAAPVPPPMR